ncbi:MAG: glycosyltransferase [Lachnospiraceae bacterium]|nr:glycosyltransferase [Lachnospiraceae bacterium]
MKKIAFLTLSLMRGGAEGVIARLCNDYLAEKYQITIITCRNCKIEYQMDERIRVICIEKQEASYRNMPERFLKRRSLLKGVLQEIEPDLLISFLPEPNFLALSLKKHFHFPMIISVRNDPKEEYKKGIYHMLMKYFYPKADGAVFQTEQAREYFKFAENLYKHSSVIENPLGNQFCYLKPATEREKVIVNVGRLDYQKNQQMLMQAFAEMADEIPSYVLKIYGSGKLKETLQQQIVDSKMEQRIILCGNVADLKEQIQNAALFVLCSDYEGMPNSLMEAMAMGIPCIATDCPCGGPKYLIEDGVNGKLIPVNDKEELIRAVKQMLGDTQYSQRMAENAVERMKELYPEKIYAKWDTYIKNYL